jgi:hypothetical protein
VIGINTAKAVPSPNGTPLQGIGFALSSADVLRLLERFYPNASVQNLSAEAAPQPGNGTVNISSDPEGADITVDGKFVGNTPSALKLSAGPHTVQVKAPGRRAWERKLEVLKDSQVTLKATLEPDR